MIAFLGALALMQGYVAEPVEVRLTDAQRRALACRCRVSPEWLTTLPDGTVGLNPPEDADDDRVDCVLRELEMAEREAPPADRHSGPEVGNGSMSDAAPRVGKRALTEGSSTRTVEQ